MRLFTMAFVVSMIGQFCQAQSLPIIRRMSILTPSFLDSALDRVGPAEVQGDKSRVLVLFRLSELGVVIDARDQRI